MVETTEANQVSRAASSLLFPELEFGLAANGTYPSEDFQRVLARIAFVNEFANTGAKALQLARGDDIAVTADARNASPRHCCTIFVASTRTRSTRSSTASSRGFLRRQLATACLPGQSTS